MELHESVRFDGPVAVDHPHPVLGPSVPCRFVAIDYAPFEDVVELRVEINGSEVRLLLDDPKEIRVDPGSSLVIETRSHQVAVHDVRNQLGWNRRSVLPGVDRTTTSRSA